MSLKVNKNENLLPNITLGAEIRDDCGTVNTALEQCLKFVLGTFTNREQMCSLSMGLPGINKSTTLGGVVGPSYSTTAVQVSKKLNSTLMELIRIKPGEDRFANLRPRLPAAHFYNAKQSKKKPW